MSESTLPILDIEQLKSNTSSDAGLAIEILSLFKQQTEIWGRLLDPAMPQAQWADAAHSLKGAALGAGAMVLADMCSAAEKAGRSERPLSSTEASVILSDVKDAVGPALEAAAGASFQLTRDGHFK